MFTADLDTTNHVVILGDNSDANLVSCPVVTLNEWVADEAPFLLKIDVEGHEDHVILGARVVLANPQLKAMVVETSLCPATGSSDGSKAADIIQEYGFRPFSYDPMNRELAPLDTQTGGNIIFVRDVDAIRDRLVSAPTYQLSLGHTI